MSDAEQNRSDRAADRIEINDLILRYWEGVRQNDPDMIASVFADDGLLDFPNGPPRGAENIQRYFAGRLGSDKAKNRGLDAILDGMPIISNIIVDLKGDEAHCEYNVFSATLAVRNGGTVLGFDGGRHSETHQRTSSGWRCVYHSKSSRWEAEIPAHSLMDSH